jgi:hypothetical protein
VVWSYGVGLVMMLVTRADRSRAQPRKASLAEGRRRPRDEWDAKIPRCSQKSRCVIFDLGLCVRIRALWCVVTPAGLSQR